MILDILTLRFSKFKSSPRVGTALALLLAAMLCWWVYAMVNENIGKNQTRELGREIAAREQRAQEEERATRRATLRAAFEALRNTPPPTCYCAELCPGRGRIPGDPVTAIWEHNGLNTDPSAPYLWTPTHFVATLLAPTHATNAPFAWPQDATLLLEDYGALIAIEHILPFYFPYAGGLCNRIAISTSGLIFFDSVAYPRGNNAWPLTTPRHGNALSALAVYYGEWQLLEGSAIETFSTNTLNGAIQGQAFRWKDMARFSNDAGTNRVTFGAILWENGDAELFHEGDIAELPGITGAQHHGANWDVPNVASGDRLTFSRLLEPHEASQDLAGDGLNRHIKWLWYLDETNPSTARDGVGDAFKLQHNLCPHTDIAQRILVSGGLRIIKAFEHNCNPWLTRAPGAPHTYNYAINMGLDPHSNWQPETFDLDAEEISFVLAAGDAPCLFTFGGVDGDPRTQQWALQTNETRTVSIMAWVDCENRISAGKSGGTVQLSGTHYSMGFSTENAPGGAPSPMKSGGSPGFEPMMTRAGGKLTCFECWLKNGGTIWPSYAYNFKRCWPPPPDARGFSVGFEDKVWCLDSPPPVLLWHTNHFLYAISSEQSRAYVPCDCTVDTWTHTEATNEPGYACQYVAHAGTTCGCVSCGGATCLVLQKPKIKITSCTKNVSPDFTTPPQGVNNTLTVSFEIENYTPEMAKHFYLTVNASRRKKDGTDETGEALPFANGQLTHTLNMANFSITWDGILTNSGYTLVEGTNTFAGFNTINEPKTLNRQLCAASIGETMPLPEFDVVVTAWHKCPRTFDVAVKASEARENVKVPQILLLRCRPNFLEKYCEHVFSEIHVGTIAVYKTPNEMPTSEYEYVEKVREYIQGQLPPNANIIVVNGHDPYIQLREGIGNVKTIWLEYELTPAVNLPAAAMGYALPTNANEGNGLRSGECFVSLQRIENYLVADYDQRRTYDSLASSNERTHIDPQIKLVAMHEPLHLMGLVSKKYLKGGVINEAVYNPISHNLDNPKDTTYIMNRLYNPLTLNAKLDAYELKPMNKEYLEFTCPKPQP